MPREWAKWVPFNAPMMSGQNSKKLHPQNQMSSPFAQAQAPTTQRGKSTGVLLGLAFDWWPRSRLTTKTLMTKTRPRTKNFRCLSLKKTMSHSLTQVLNSSSRNPRLVPWQINRKLGWRSLTAAGSYCDIFLHQDSRPPMETCRDHRGNSKSPFNTGQICPHGCNLRRSRWHVI